MDAQKEFRIRSLLIVIVAMSAFFSVWVIPFWLHWFR